MVFVFSDGLVNRRSWGTYACVVDEHVDFSVALCQDFFGAFFDGIERVELCFDHVDWGRVGWGGCQDFVDYGLSLGHVADGCDDSGASGMEGTDSFDTNASRTSRHDEYFVTEFAFKALVLDDLKGSWPSVAETLRVLVSGGVARHDGMVMSNVVSKKRLIL